MSCLLATNDLMIQGGGWYRETIRRKGWEKRIIEGYMRRMVTMTTGHLASHEPNPT